MTLHSEPIEDRESDILQVGRSLRVSESERSQGTVSKSQVEQSTPEAKARPAPARRTKPVPRSLWPKEHGAYGQLGVPLLAALLLARPSWASLFFALSSVFLFLLHEPLLVVLGQRGKRAINEVGERAWRLIWQFGITAAVLGLAAMVLAPETLWASAIAVLMAVVIGLLVFTKLEKTALGEVIVSSSLAWCGTLVALAAGVELRMALIHWLAWAVSFASITFTVRGMIARSRRRSSQLPGRFGLIFSLLIAGLAVAAWHLQHVGPGPALAVLVMVAMSFAIGAVGLHARYLKEAGWATMAAMIAGLLALLLLPALAG